MYDSLFEIYDSFNNDFDYRKYLKTVFERWQLPSSGLLLDCGCGTGSLLEILLERGYDCTGVDGSENMLARAEEKLENAGFSAHLVCQDLAELDLYGAYNLVFCTLDTVNHISDKRQLKRFFRRLYNFMEYDAYFVFDAKTKAGFEKTNGQRVFEEDGKTLIMNGDFNGKYAFYDFSCFEETENGLYEKSADYVEERFYEPTELKAMVISAGLSYVGRVLRQGRCIFCFSKKR